jgi:hypothetical protein
MRETGRKGFIAILIILISTTPFLQAAKGKAALPLSALFARMAFVMQQEYTDWALTSYRSVNSDVDVFSLTETAVDDEMERIEEFDIQTNGDKKLLEMLFVARTMIVRAHTQHIQDHIVTRNLNAEEQAAYRAKVKPPGTPYLDCLSSIRETISRRVWTGNGACVLQEN